MILATVTSTAPLSVRIDGATSEAPATIAGAPAPVAGDRVLVDFIGGRLYVVAKAGAAAGGGGGGPVNADTLDGIDSAGFWQKTEAVDAATLDGIDSTGFAQLGHGHDLSAYATKTGLNTAMAAARAPQTMTTNGFWLVEAGHLRWTQRLLVIGLGRGTHWSTAGYHNLNVPAAATVIPGYGGHAGATITAAGYFPLAINDTLWAIPTVGGDQAAISYAYTRYTGNFVVPDHWIFVAARGDDGRVRVGTGETLDYWRAPTFSNGWVNYGAAPNTMPAAYKKVGELVVLRGLVKNGTLGSTIFTLPAGYRPAGIVRGVLTSDGTNTGRLIAQNDGLVYAVAAAGNAEVSLDPMRFVAEA